MDLLSHLRGSINAPFQTMDGSVRQVVSSTGFLHVTAMD
jgi:hypothetical protein